MAFLSKLVAKFRPKAPARYSDHAPRNLRRNARHLGYEPLESRDLLAGVSLDNVISLPMENVPEGSSYFNTQIAQDQSGATYLSGTLAGATIDLDPSNGAADDPAIVSAASFIAKYDPAGAFEWVRTLDGQSAGGSITQLKVAPSGNIYFAGRYNINDGGSLAMNGVPLVEVGDTANFDRFIGKLDPDGNVAWLQGFDLGNQPYLSISGSAVSGLAVDEVNQRVYVTGVDDTVAGFGEHNEGIVVALNTSGITPSVAWSATLTVKISSVAITGSSALDVAVDGAGSVYIAGSFYGAADFDPSPSKTLSISSGSAGKNAAPPTGGYVWKLTPQGSLGWAKTFDGASGGGSVAEAIAVDGTGSVLAAGYFRGTVDFDSSKAKYNLTSAGDTDAFLVKLTSAGAFTWATRAGGTGADSFDVLALDAAGNIYVAGPAFTSGPTVIAKYNNIGNQVWSQSLVGNYVRPTSLLVSSTGQVHLVGSYRGTVNADADLELELDSGDPSTTGTDLFWLIYGQT